ncbi:MAG: phosphoglycolate phosphatase [Methanobacteriaceae archaeon]|jgi:phosphoglycolate phosphatase (TIGR01487 family)|nr:phosphoglycolate phosphatase [Methanobacteriaceae archaeon]OPY19661.1 MAG: Phosphoglycolate phosphatase [Methanobacterium sp. PtaU1.Bin097]
MEEHELKAIALDVDGTMTDNSRKICISAIEAISQAEENGIPVIIVTGNILCAAKMLAIMLGTTGGVVSENGGVIEYKGARKLLGNIEECKRAFKYLKTKYPVQKVEFSDERISEVAIERNIKEEIVKETLKDFNVEIYDTNFAIHLTDPSVDKGSSLEILAAYNGVKTEEIMAIGDSENDIEFLRVAGLRVAVNNADKELKAIADYVTSEPHGDGVAEAIYKFII